MSQLMESAEKLKTIDVLAQRLPKACRVQAVGAEVARECSQGPERWVSILTVLSRLGEREEERGSRTVLPDQSKPKTGESRTRHIEIVVSALGTFQPRQNKFGESGRALEIPAFSGNRVSL